MKNIVKDSKLLKEFATKFAARPFKREELERPITEDDYVPSEELQRLEGATGTANSDRGLKFPDVNSAITHL